MRHQSPIRIVLVIAIAALVLIITGCNVLSPVMSYQGRLTDETGEPLEGNVNLTFKLYDADVGGTEIYSESQTDVAVSDGLFDTTVGPATLIAGLTPKDLAQPLWLEVTVDDGTHTETLAPRQRLLGAPYAFTLMPGAVVSGTMDTGTYGPYDIEAVLSVYNPFEDPGANPALPALLIRGEKGIELTGADGGAGTIYSDHDLIHSDIEIHSHDNVEIYLDTDGGSNGVFRIHKDDGAVVFTVDENGTVWPMSVGGAVVQIDDEYRSMTPIASPEVWFEDIGAAALQEGAAVVSIDRLFAKTVNLNAGYHVFLTPLGDCNGLYVANKTGAGIEVRELGGGASSVSFDYRIVAHRAGYEDLRLELEINSMDAAEAD
jgi:hypothetical protein